MASPDSITVLRTDVVAGATKSFTRTPRGEILTTAYSKVAYWQVSSRPVASFDDLARELGHLVDDQQAMVIRAEPKPGIDLTKPVRRRMHGALAAFDDVPRRWLHLDLDNVAAPHLDVVGDPGGAIDYAIDLVASSAPELEGLSAFAAFSSSAGVRNTTTAKMHIWHWLDRAYSGDELKRWAAGVNDRAGSKLIDPAVFGAVQPNYTGRPVFAGMLDPLLGHRRWAICKGLVDETALVIPDEAPRRARTSTVSSEGASYGPGGGFAFYLSHIDGEGPHGLRDPARSAMASLIASLGAARGEADRDSIITTVADALQNARRGERSEAVVEQYIDGLNSMFDWLIARQRETETKDSQAPPTYAGAGVPLDEAERAVEHAIGGFFEHIAAGEVPALALRCSAGLGKTHSALVALARSGRRAVMLVPRHKLSDELLERAQALGIDAQAWRGRDARDPAREAGSLMCIEQEIYDAAKRADLVDEACVACPSQPVCPYMAQRARAPTRLEIMANNFSTRRPPAAVVRKAIDLVILDEQFADRSVDDPRELMIDALSSPPTGVKVEKQADIDERRAPLRRALRAAMELGQLRIEHLEEEKIDADWCRCSEAAEWSAKPCVKVTAVGRVSIIAQLKKLKGRFDSRPALLWQTVRQFIDAASDTRAKDATASISGMTVPERGPIESGAIEMIEINTDAGAAPGVRFRVRRELRSEWVGKPTLILDAATMPDNERLRQIFGRPVERVEIVSEMPASVKVMQLVDPAPISAFVDVATGAAKRRLEDAAGRVEIMSRQYCGQGCDGIDLVVIGGSAAIADRLRDELLARGLDVSPKAGASRLHAIEVRHCGDLAGEDRFGGVRALVQVGWSLPPAAALEREVGAQTGIMPGRLPRPAWAMTPGGLRMRAGTGRRVDRPSHSDPAVEALRLLKTEGEMLQALGRARWARRTAATPLDLLILSNLPLPEIVVDQAVRWADVKAFRLEMAFDRWGGVLPLRPLDLVRTGLWATDKAADRALEASGVRKDPPAPLEYFFIKPAGGLKSLRYRHAGQRAWSRALVDAALPEAQAVERLRAATGSPELIVDLPAGEIEAAAPLL